MASASRVPIDSGSLPSSPPVVAGNTAPGGEVQARQNPYHVPPPWPATWSADITGSPSAGTLREAAEGIHPLTASHKGVPSLPAASKLPATPPGTADACKAHHGGAGQAWAWAQDRIRRSQLCHARRCLSRAQQTPSQERASGPPTTGIRGYFEPRSSHASHPSRGVQLQRVGLESLLACRPPLVWSDCTLSHHASGAQASAMADTPYGAAWFR